MLEGGGIRKHPLLMFLPIFFFCLTLSFCLSCYLLEGAEIYNVNGEHVSGTSYVLAVDATVHYLSEEHLPLAIFASLIFFLLLLPPLLLILYACKVFSRCLNCCCRRRWHALHIFVDAFQGCYKNGVSEGWNSRSMSGVYMLLCYVLLLVNYRILPQIGCAGTDVPEFYPH